MPLNEVDDPDFLICDFMLQMEIGEVSEVVLVLQQR